MYKRIITVAFFSLILTFAFSPVLQFLLLQDQVIRNMVYDVSAFVALFANPIVVGFVGLWIFLGAVLWVTPGPVEVFRRWSNSGETQQPRNGNSIEPKSIVEARSVIDLLEYSLDGNAKATAAALLHEAERHGREARRFLWAIAIVFVGMLFGIVFAGGLARLDLSFIDPAKSDSLALESLIKKDWCLLLVLGEVQQVRSRPGPVVDAPKELFRLEPVSSCLDAYFSTAPSLRRETFNNALAAIEQSKLEDMIADNREQIKDHRKAVREWRNMVRESASLKEDAGQTLGRANVIRFGITAISIYLVSILLSVYRFKMQMSSYYKRKFSAFVMARGEVDSFIKLNALLEKERFDLEPAPATPLESFLRIFRRRAGAESKATSERAKAKGSSSTAAATLPGQ